MTKTRPDWVHCIAHYRVDQPLRTWCGVALFTSLEFAFVNIDHAAGVGEQKGRLQACPQCLDLIEAALRDVRWRP